VGVAQWRAQGVVRDLGARPVSSSRGLHVLGPMRALVSPSGSIFCDDNNIWVDWALITHPRMNGQVEHANGLTLQGLKPRIFSQEGKDVHARLSTGARN
jgi:hypothetical protein